MKHENRNAKILLIGAEDEENLALRYLAAVLEKDGHYPEIVPCSTYSQFNNVLKAVGRVKPDLIGISIAFQSRALLYFDLISKIRDWGYMGHVTVGGHFPTFEFEKILGTQPGIDSVIRFEGEVPIVQLADYILGKSEPSSVNNLAFRTPKGVEGNECIRSFQDLDGLPFPKRNRKPMERLGEKFATLVSSRGCWHSKCLYCCIGAFHSRKKGKRFAFRSPESIAREISELYDCGVRLFQFHDDNFMFPSQERNSTRLGEMKKSLEEKEVDPEKIAFLIKARPDSITEKTALALKELGVVGVFLGVENATESGLTSLQRGTSLRETHRAITRLDGSDIAVTFNLLIFHPNATLEEIDRNIDFMSENLKFPFDFGRAEVVAGSPLEKMLMEKDKLIGKWPNLSYTIDDESAEKIFRVNAKTFRRRGSYYSTMVHSSIALSYHAHILRRLHGGPITEELFSEYRELIPRINAFIVDALKRTRDMGIDSPSEPEIKSLYKELSSGCQEFLKSTYELQGRMLRLSLTDKVFQYFGVGPLLQKRPIFRTIFSF